VIKLGILVSFLLNVVPPELIQMRNLYEKLDKNETHTRALDQLAKNSSAISANLKNAYLAVTYMALSQYQNNPVSKWKGFNEGKNRLEKIIQADSSSLEIRYMRLSIQQHAPGILGYNSSITKDKRFLILNLSLLKKSDSDLFVRIYTYLLIKCKLSDEDKRLINT
jgi:hypothetical protein